MTEKKTFGSYRIRSNKWTVRCQNGKSLSKGLGACGLSIGGKAISMKILAEKFRSGREPGAAMTLQLSLTGIELSAEVGVDLLESVIGLQLAYTKAASDGSLPLYLNSKNPGDLSSHDFTGPCALISYAVGEVTIGMELPKIAGKTFLLFNMGAVVADVSGDWLTRVVDSTEGKSTLGGCFKAFNADGSIFNHARAAVQLDLTDFSSACRVKGVGVGLFSGTVAVTKFEKK